MDAEMIANHIFGKSPKEPNTINIKLDGEGYNLTVRDIFEFLLTTFTDGSKLLYGDANEKVDIGKWSEKEVETLKKYFHSFGFDIKIKIYNNMKVVVNDYRTASINNPLDKLQFALQCGDTTYVISFDYYKNL